MASDEPALLIYARLAALSWRKRQLPGRDRFLLLAGAAACRSGRLELAERCRNLVLANNPAHLLGKFNSFAEAMRSPDLQSLLKRLGRMCPLEKAEHLLQQQGIEAPRSEENQAADLDALVQQLLADPGETKT